MRSRILPGIGGLAGVGAVWWGLSLVLGDTLIPAPPEVVAVLVRLLVHGQLLLHAGASLLRLVAGITVATALAIPIGIAAGISRTADRLVSPVVYVLYPLPKIALFLLEGIVVQLMWLYFLRRPTGRQRNEN